MIREYGAVRQPERTRPAPGMGEFRPRDLLVDIAKFRIVKVDDVIDFRYRGNVSLFLRHVDKLEQAGLGYYVGIQVKPFPAKPLTVLSLTPQGRSQAKQIVGEQQQVYHGLQRKADLYHDTAIYRAYLVEEREIEANGGRVLQVKLEPELQRDIIPELDRARRSTWWKGPQERKREVAEKHGMKLHEGRVLIPDLRIKYEDKDGQERYLDVEIRSKGSKAKVQARKAAGVKIHPPHTHAGAPAHRHYKR